MPDSDRTLTGLLAGVFVISKFHWLASVLGKVEFPVYDASQTYKRVSRQSI